MGKKIVVISLLGLTFVALNIFSRFLYSQSWFGDTSFSKELNPFDIISLVVSSGITLWLGWYVSKKLSEQRYEKEYVIADLKRIEDEIEIIERNLQFPSIEIQTILDHLANLKNCMDRFTKTAQIFQIKCVNSTRLETLYRTLYLKTTNLEGNVLLSDNPIRNEINHVCGEIIIESRSIVFKINKH